MKNSIFVLILIFSSAHWLHAQQVHADTKLYTSVAKSFITNGDKGDIRRDDHYVRAAIVIELIDGNSGQPIHGRGKITDVSTGERIPYLAEADKMIFVGGHGRQYSIEAASEGYKNIEVVFTASMKKKIAILMTPVWAMNNEQALLLR